MGLAQLGKMTRPVVSLLLDGFDFLFCVVEVYVYPTLHLYTWSLLSGCVFKIFFKNKLYGPFLGKHHYIPDINTSGSNEPLNVI